MLVKDEKSGNIKLLLFSLYVSLFVSLLLSLKYLFVHVLYIFISCRKVKLIHSRRVGAGNGRFLLTFTTLNIFPGLWGQTINRL